MSLLRTYVKELLAYVERSKPDLPPSMRVYLDELRICLVLDKSPEWSGDPHDTACVPNEIRAGLKQYAERRVRCGDFLHAVLENDLKGAIGKADPTNIQILPAIVTYVFDSIPAVAWGSSARVKDWLSGRYEEEVAQ